MKTIQVTARNLFKGELTGGLNYEEWAAASELERFQHRLMFIRERAQALIDSGSLADRIVDAMSISRSAQQALRAMDAGDLLGAASASIDTGKKMGELNRYLDAWDTIQITVAYRQSKSEHAKKKTGKKGPIKIAVEKMCAAIPECSYVDLLDEMEADAAGKECLIYNLRETGEISVKFKSVNADQIVYDELNGKPGKTLKVRRLSNVLSEVKRAG